MKKIIFFVAIYFLLSNNSFSQEAATPKEVAPFLYEVPLMGCNAAFFVSDSGVIVIDAGMTTDDGLQLVNAISTVTNKPIKYLIFTHYHFDHTGGILAFPKNIKNWVSPLLI
ncbi:MAG: MBL fold metallo-hydrolase [Bacteroidota bacterium]